MALITLAIVVTYEDAKGVEAVEGFILLYKLVGYLLLFTLLLAPSISYMLLYITAWFASISFTIINYLGDFANLFGYSFVLIILWGTFWYVLQARELKRFYQQ